MRSVLADSQAAVRRVRRCNAVPVLTGCASPAAASTREWHRPVRVSAARRAFPLGRLVSESAGFSRGLPPFAEFPYRRSVFSQSLAEQPSEQQLPAAQPRSPSQAAERPSRAPSAAVQASGAAHLAAQRALCPPAHPPQSPRPPLRPPLRSGSGLRACSDAR